MVVWRKLLTHSHKNNILENSSIAHFELPEVTLDHRFVHNVSRNLAVIEIHSHQWLFIQLRRD